VGIHHIEVRLSIQQRGRFETRVFNAATLGIPIGIEHRNIVLFIALFE